MSPRAGHFLVCVESAPHVHDRDADRARQKKLDSESSTERPVVERPITRESPTTGVGLQLGELIAEDENAVIRGWSGNAAPHVFFE